MLHDFEHYFGGEFHETGWVLPCGVCRCGERLFVDPRGVYPVIDYVMVWFWVRVGPLVPRVPVF